MHTAVSSLTLRQKKLEKPQYKRRYPNKHTFSDRSFTTGTFSKPICGRELMRRNNSEKVLGVIENDPGTSTKKSSVLTWQTRTAVQSTFEKTDCILIINNRYKPCPRKFSPKSCSFFQESSSVIKLHLQFTRDRINNFYSKHVSNRKPPYCSKNAFPE